MAGGVAEQVREHAAAAPQPVKQDLVAAVRADTAAVPQRHQPDDGNDTEQVHVVLVGGEDEQVPVDDSGGAEDLVAEVAAVFTAVADKPPAEHQPVMDDLVAGEPQQPEPVKKDLGAEDSPDEAVYTAHPVKKKQALGEEAEARVPAEPQPPQPVEKDLGAEDSPDEAVYTAHPVKEKQVLGDDAEARVPAEPQLPLPVKEYLGAEVAAQVREQSVAAPQPVNQELGAESEEKVQPAADEPLAEPDDGYGTEQVHRGLVGGEVKPEAGEHEVDEPPEESVAAPVDEPSAESVAPVDKTPTALSATVDEPPAEPVAALVDEPPGAEVAPVDGPPAAAREAVHATGEAHDEAQAIGEHDEEDSPAVVRDEPPDEGADEPPPPVRDKPDHAADNVSAAGGHDAHDPAGGADDELAQGEHDVYEPPAEPVAALVDKPPGGEVAPVDMTTATLSAPVNEHPAE